MKLEKFNNLADSNKLAEIYKSVEKTRNYIKWSLIASVAFILLPLLFLPVVISRFLGAYDLGVFGL